MPTDWEALDYDDPCAVLAALRPAYYRLVAGSMRETVEFQAGNGQTRRVTFTRTNIAALRAEVARMEIRCKAAQTGKTPRFAVQGGGST